MKTAENQAIQIAPFFCLVEYGFFSVFFFVCARAIFCNRGSPIFWYSAYLLAHITGALADFMIVLGFYCFNILVSCVAATK